MNIELSTDEMNYILDAINFTMKDYEGVETKEWFDNMERIKQIFQTEK